MDAARKRELSAAYKERRPRVGLYAIRCTPTGQVWVGLSRNLDAQENSLRFALRQASHPNRALLAPRADHGDAAFTYQELEAIDDQALTPIGVKARLAEREQAWRAELKADKATG